MTDRNLRLSADDLRQMTDWPDALIEDYLAISGVLVITSTTVNSVVQEFVSVSSSVDQQNALIVRLGKEIAELSESVSSLSADKKVINITKQVEELKQAIVSYDARAKIVKLQKQLDEIAEQINQPKRTVKTDDNAIQLIATSRNLKPSGESLTPAQVAAVSSLHV